MPTITNQGAVPIPPTTLLANELAAASLLAPGLTGDLPGSLVEDMASTATGATIVIDQAAADLINSLSPMSANGGLLYQLGQVTGVTQGQGSNTSVYVTFVSNSNIGETIIPGFTVSDGTYQYVVQDGGVIESSGMSAPLFCLSTTPGIFSVPIGTVTQIVTSLPTGVSMTCTNQVAGVPGQSAQSLQDYRSQVIQAGQATAQGMPQFIKTQLNKVAGVQSRLVSVIQSTNKWEVVVGGGDPYAVANAILIGASDISNLTGSTLLAATITNAYPAVVGTNLNHGYTTGQAVQLAGATGMSGINGIPFIAVVLTEKTFSLNVATSSLSWATGTVTVTTAQPHNLPGGTSSGYIAGVVPTAYNGSYTFTKTGANTFTYPLVSNPGSVTVQGYTGFDSVTSGSYTVSTATITPNLRNITVSLSDYPDTYSIPFVIPPVQTVSLVMTWNTISTNFVSPTVISSLAIPALASYINSIAVGQPINVFDLQSTFQSAVSSVLPIALISKMLFTVDINTIPTSPSGGTGVIYGDPESYFLTSNSLITISQG